MELLLDTVRGRYSTELGARLAAAHTIALQFGWCLFGDFLRVSTGLDDVDDRTFARSIGSTVALILRRRGADELLGQGAGDPFGGRHQRPRGGHGDDGVDLR